MKFEIQGSFRAQKIGNVWQPFAKIVEGNSEKSAIERLFSLMGSKHGLKRSLIKIEGVKLLE